MNDEKKTKALEYLEPIFDELEKECWDTFKRSEPHDDAGRTACHFYLRVMDDVKSRCTLVARRGEIARKELISINKPKVRQING
jgi:hypothetical protein